VPVRAIKTTTISILAVGLLAGSAVGVVAQDEEEPAGASVGCEEPLVEPGDYAGTNEYEDLSQEYWVVVPDDYADLAPVPVILILSAGSGDAEENYGWWRPYLDATRSLIVVAGAPGFGTTPSLPPEVHLALLDTVSAAYCIDPQRVHAVGSSSSAGKVTRLACAAPDRIASFAAAIGPFQILCEPGRPVPLLAITGDDARVVTTSSVEWWADHNGCDPEPTAEDLGSGVTRRTFQGCEADVSFYDVDGGGHAAFFRECIGFARTPGGAFCEENAVFDQFEQMERFFGEHPLPAE